MYYFYYKVKRFPFGKKKMTIQEMTSKMFETFPFSLQHKGSQAAFSDGSIS